MYVTIVNLLSFSVSSHGTQETSAIDSCPQAGDRWITQRQVLWNSPDRAYHTLPRELELSVSIIRGAGLGIRATTFIPTNTWMAEYEGTVDHEHGPQYSEYSFKVPRKHHVIDARDPATSNWSRWLNCARAEREENVMIAHCAGRIFLISRRAILPGEELMFYYGDDYARVLGVKYRITNMEY